MTPWRARWLCPFVAVLGGGPDSGVIGPRNRVAKLVDGFAMVG